MNVILRRASEEDRAAILEVEAKSTPNLRYLGKVFHSFVTDRAGELIVAEYQGAVVACGKFTILPDGSAWLEALRVIPECQGLGIGKLFYERFFVLARQKGVTAMRMYTNAGNKASKGLAERYGFTLTATYRGMGKECSGCAFDADASFERVKCSKSAIELIMPYASKWDGFVVMNRTFYALTKELCTSFAAEEKVYHHARSQSIVVMGARFMPEQALHIALWGGDWANCLGFAKQQAAQLKVQRLQCMIPPQNTEHESYLTQEGFTPDPYDCIVMEVVLD